MGESIRLPTPSSYSQTGRSNRNLPGRQGNQSGPKARRKTRNPRRFIPTFKELINMDAMSSTKFAIQQLIQSVLTISVLGGDKDIKILEEIIEKQTSPNEDDHVLDRNLALVPIIRHLIKQIQIR